MSQPRLRLLIIISALAAGLAFSQTSPPAPQPPHQTKVYVDYEQNKIFWPFTQPFWVRLATSPEPDAQTFLLERVGPRSKPATAQKFSAKGIELEVTGSQFVRWFNIVTRDTLYLEFFADGDAPKTLITYLDAPRYTSKTTQFYGVNLSSTLTPTDDLSGVAATYYSVDGAPFAQYSSAIPFSVEKLIFLRYYSLDNVGNAAKLDEVIFQVDLSPPTSHYAVLKNNIGDVLGPNARIELTTGDLLAGVNTLYYKWDNEPKYQIYKTEPLAVNHLTDGNHSLTYYAKDNVENNEKPLTYPFYHDNTPPIETATIVGDEWVQGPTRFVSIRSRVNLTAVDNQIGVDHIEQTFVKDKFTTYFDPVPMPTGAKGPIIFMHRSFDRLGNLSKVSNYPLLVDTEPPKSKCEFSGIKVIGYDVVWCTSTTKIVLSSADTASGVKHINYILAGKPPTIYQEPFSIDTEGGYLLNYWGVDRVNNIEPLQKFVVYVDNSPPIIYHFFSIQCLDSTKTASGDYLMSYPPGVRLFVVPTDAASGVSGAWCKVDGQKEEPYTDPYEFKTKGEHSVSVRTVDKVTNESTKEIRFLIQD